MNQQDAVDRGIGQRQRKFIDQCCQRRPRGRPFQHALRRRHEGDAALAVLAKQAEIGGRIAKAEYPLALRVLTALEREGWSLTDILVTHHHGDHVGGVAELKQKYRCRVVGPHDKSAKIADVDLRAGQGDVVKVGSLLARVLETPGHTLDHISYVFDSEKPLFAADTLFSIGCGRVFEGNYPMMWDSLLKLRALPDDFKLYCGHEYTAANVKFALTIEPDNAALKARAEEVKRLRAENKPTVPTLLGEEKKANVFLRADEPSVAASVRMKGKSAAQGFAEFRERKKKS